VKRLLAVAALALVALAGWLWWSSDRRRIDRRLDALVAACEKSGPDSALALLGKTQTILDSFAADMLVRAEPYGGSFRDARELAGLIHRYRAGSSRVEIAATDRELVVRANRTAEMSAVFRVAGEGRGGSGIETFRARLFWVEDDGVWRIREVEIVERLESSGLFF
jgi:hypothetical protein